MESKLISIQEANKMLPLIKSIVASIMEAWQTIIVSRTDLETYQQGKVDPVVLKSKKEELNIQIDKINGYIREIEDLGCFMEEFNRGVVNFPSLFRGRKIFLCWLPTDDHVRFWHELDETMRDRLEIREEGFLVYPVGPNNKPAYKC